MSKWKFEKAKDVEPDWPDYIGFIRYNHNKIMQEFYVPAEYLKEGKIDDISPAKIS